MSSKPNTLTMARDAIFNHAGAFTSNWGETEQDGDGVVHFSTPPAALATLRVEPAFNKRWMGGTCSMNLIVSHQASDTGSATLTFKGSRGGHFSGKVEGAFSESLLNTLNADMKLKKTLHGNDLESLTIHIKDGTVNTILTPYGGGLVYLVLPPMRSVIPLPTEQIDSLAWALEKIALHIESIQKIK